MLIFCGCYSDAADDRETKAKKHADPLDLITDIRLHDVCFYINISSLVTVSETNTKVF